MGILARLFGSKKAKAKPAKETVEYTGQITDWQDGVVKKYKPDKKFGFIQVDGAEKDVFIHGSKLPKGVTTLNTGQKVRVRFGKTAKGLNVEEISL